MEVDGDDDVNAATSGAGVFLWSSSSSAAASLNSSVLAQRHAAASLIRADAPRFFLRVG